jgi:hypothetical protein
MEQIICCERQRIIDAIDGLQAALITQHQQIQEALTAAHNALCKIEELQANYTRNNPNTHE